MISRGARVGRCYAGRAPSRLAALFLCIHVGTRYLTDCCSVARAACRLRRRRQERVKARLGRRRRRRHEAHLAGAVYDLLMAQAKQSYKAQGQAFPKPGTTGYQTIKGEAVTLLVQERRARAEGSLDSGSPSPTKQVDDPAHRAEEAVLRRQREEVPGAAEDPGPHRRARPLRRQVAAHLGSGSARS